MGTVSWRRAGASRTADRRLLRTWTIWVSVAELAAFSVPVVVGALLWDAPGAIFLGAIVVAGAFEGTVLGLAQALVLRRRIAGLSVRRWVIATAVAAAIAYVLGMLPSSLQDAWQGWPQPVQALSAVVLAAALLSSIGVGQWLVLRRHLRRAAAWIAITAGGWAAGLAVFMGIATPLWRPGQSALVVSAIGVLAGAMMAVGMAFLTGLGLLGLLGIGQAYPARNRAPAGSDSAAAQRSEVSRSDDVSLGGSTNR